LSDSKPTIYTKQKTSKKMGSRLKTQNKDIETFKFCEMPLAIRALIHRNMESAKDKK
jgi:hypothetical protein